MKLDSPDTNGRYVGHGRVLYVLVANSLGVSEAISDRPVRFDLPLPSDEEVGAAHAAGGRITQAMKEEREEWLRSVGKGVL